MITPIKEDEAQREAAQYPPQPYPPPMYEHGPSDIQPPPPVGAPNNSYTPANPQMNYPPPQVPPQGSPYPQRPQPQSPMERDVELGRQYQAAMYARCAQGMHEPTTKYGACGIIAAILLFPFGLIFLCIDKEERCARCGISIL